MHRLGKALHLSSNRNLILKTESQPKIGDRVVDENLRFVGTVFDVFGPVSSPYVAVKPAVSRPQRLVRNVLYTVPSAKRKLEKEKYGR